MPHRPGLIERTVRSLDTAVHGDFEPLLGDKQAEWWDFVTTEVANLADGIFMEIRLPDFSIWSGWNVIQPDAIDHEGLYFPGDEAEDPFERPDEHLDWQVWRITVDP